MTEYTKRQTIFNDVLSAMHEAEDMPPENYHVLMMDIAIEAIARSKGMRWPREKRKLSLDEFRATGRNVRFADVPSLKNIDISAEYGRLYEGNGYIELMNDGMWHLVLSNEEWVEDSLPDLERRLYDCFYMEEIA